MNGYYPDPTGISTVCTACSSTLTNCATCQLAAGTNTFACLTCSAGYAWSGTICDSCTITNCLTAVLSGLGSCTCSVCVNGYTANGAGGCNLCSASLGPYCTKCSSQTICTECNTGLQYYLNPTSHACQTCSLNGCSVCSGLTTCQTCNTGGDFFMDPGTGNTCIACSLP